MKKKILLTGFTGGIGSEIIRILSNDYIFINLARKITNSEINPLNSHYNLDFNSIEQLEKVIDTILIDHGNIDGIIHTAGNDFLSPLSYTNEIKMKDLFNIHVFFTISLISLAMRKKLLKSNSSIILFSSLSAHKASPGHGVYASAKGALEGFLPTASNELSKKSIRLNVIVPGIVKTKMANNYLGKLSEDQLNQLKNSYPFGFIEPVDIVNLVSFLLSDKSLKITGQKFIIDGGNSIFF
jgi:NAD(P)-dependent dehydrogenase (short-subunit alcohol dehydrogenase family)